MLARLHEPAPERSGGLRHKTPTRWCHVPVDICCRRTPLNHIAVGTCRRRQQRHKPPTGMRIEASGCLLSLEGLSVRALVVGQLTAAGPSPRIGWMLFNIMHIVAIAIGQASGLALARCSSQERADTISPPRNTPSRDNTVIPAVPYVCAVEVVALFRARRLRTDPRMRSRTSARKLLSRLVQPGQPNRQAHSAASS